MNTHFSQEYKKLNPEQKEAVDSIEGPVMVIAGAGTGKTQTIALRIGKILTDTQVNPNNILCLTFTDNAALNMRDRLISLIGSPAYSVRIATFHAFCNSIIKDHPEYFLKSIADSQAIDDATKIEIIRQILDSFPFDCPLKNINSPYYYQKEIISALSTLKKENISTSYFKELVKDNAEFVDLSQPYYEKLRSLRATKKSETEIISLVHELSKKISLLVLYQSRIDYLLNLFNQELINLTELKNELKNFIEKSTINLPKIKELSLIYQQYQQTLTDKGLYDYEDMILWVIEALKNHSELLSSYQENYQYLLVDEFQDTNSSQMEILNLLTADNDNPNLFVVGDDDQSIFRFQGANIENLKSFYDRYGKKLKIVVLKNNYRSHQLILNSSIDVIDHNENRISLYIKNIDKSLISSKNYDQNPINFFQANTQIEENYWISQKIKTLLSTGVEGKEIAVLYRNNVDVNDLLPFLSQNNINYLRSDTINILDNLKIQQLLTLLKYLADPTNDSLLAQVLSFSFLKFSSLSLYKLFRLVHKEKLSLSDVILDSELLTSHHFSQKFIDKLALFQNDVSKSLKDIQNLPSDEIFNLIIRRFSFLNYVLKSKDLSLLKQLNSLYSHLKQSQTLQKTSLFDWLKKIDLLYENKIALNSPPLESLVDNSIRLMTVHKAKGLEFEHVFIIKALSEKWDKSTDRALIKLPLGITKYTLNEDPLEEERRLFYVALTRAKQQIYLSYCRLNDSQREQSASRFITEINPQRIEKISVNPEFEAESLQFSFSPRLPRLKSKNLTIYLQNQLSYHYRFNITHLNSYLKCPLCFFFKTILRLPYSKAKAMSFGTAVHGALAYLTQVYKSQNKLISQEKFVDVFENNLKRENLSENDFNSLLDHGREILSGYYQNYRDSFNGRCLTEHDFKFNNVYLDEIPITGKIDKIEFLSGKQVNVVDYKTGKPDYKYQQLSPEGDYFRQLVFYKLLCDEAKTFPYKVVSGTIDFIEANKKNQYIRKNYKITSEDTAKLKSQIVEVFNKIKSLDFTPSPKCEDKDHLHILFGKYFKS